MKRTDAHIIGRQAERIFESLIPSEWVFQKQVPDYGIDYVVEVFSENESTGRYFAVQLKGKADVRKSVKSVRFSLSTKHLAHYLDNMPMPVFLVVVDTRKEDAFYIYLQKQAKECGFAPGWRLRKSVTVRIPRRDTLADGDRFRSIASEAANSFRYQLGLNVKECVKARTLEFSELDSRFRVGVCLKDDGEHIDLQAVEPVELKLKLTGDASTITAKVEDWIERGLPVDFDPGELEISGSPIFDRWGKSGGTMQVARTLPLDIVLVSRGENASLISAIRGKAIGGQSELRYEGSLPNSPLRLAFVFQTRPQPDIKECALSIQLDEWLGQALRTLAYFPDIARFCDWLSKDGGCDVRCSMYGNDLFRLKLDTTEQGKFRALRRLFDGLRKARQISGALGVNPVWTRVPTREDILEINELYDLMFIGSHQRDGRLANVSAEIKVNSRELASLRTSLQSFNSPISFILSPGRYSVLGETCYPYLGWMQMTLDHAAVQSVKETCIGDDAFVVRIRWTGSHGSRFRICRPKLLPVYAND